MSYNSCCYYSVANTLVKMDHLPLVHTLQPQEVHMDAKKTKVLSFEDDFPLQIGCFCFRSHVDFRSHIGGVGITVVKIYHLNSHRIYLHILTVYSTQWTLLRI